MDNSLKREERNYVAINRLLLECFPEIADEYRYEADQGIGEDTGSIIFYDLVFNPFIARAVADRNEDLIERIASFVEELLNHPDAERRAVATTSFAPFVRSEPDVLSVIRPFLKAGMTKFI